MSPLPQSGSATDINDSIEISKYYHVLSSSIQSFSKSIKN